MPWTSPAPTPTPRRKNFLNRAWNPYLQTFVLFDLSKISIMRKIHRIWLKKITFEVLGQRTHGTRFSQTVAAFSFLWTLQPLFGYLLFALVFTDTSWFSFLFSLWCCCHFLLIFCFVCTSLRLCCHFSLLCWALWATTRFICFALNIMNNLLFINVDFCLFVKFVSTSIIHQQHCRVISVLYLQQITEHQ